MRPAVGAAAAAAVLAAGAAFGADNLVVNGGFEAGSTLAGSGWTTSGFAAEGFDHAIDTAAGNAHGGGQSFAGGAIGGLGFIRQTLATVPGTVYDISLWVANLSGFAENTALQVQWGGAVVYEASGLLGFDYRQIRLSLPAGATSTVLAIGVRDDSFFLNIDDVVVSAVPEPGAAALFVLGLAGIGAALRRRGARAGA